MNIKQIASEIANPRFTTEEMETSHTRCRFEFKITSMLFDDKPRFPTRAYGNVKTDCGHVINVNWNEHGECHHQNNRMTAFDLVRPTQGEIDSAKIIGGATLLTIGAILITSIF